jgi:mannose-6-phosphate isomerase-like protein (cupin superfamily)
MKKSIIISILAVSMALAFSACNNTAPSATTVDSKTTEKAVYTCTMHPEVRSDKPGDCQKCGMKLVKMEAADSTQMHNHADTMQMH